MQMMRSEETRAQLKDPSCTAPGQKLIEMQRAGWDILGIDRDIGVSFLNKLESIYPGDTELAELKVKFMQQAQRSFLKAWEDKKPATLETKKPMTRDVICEFFDLCNTKMDLPETHLVLKKHIEKTKQVPNKVIIRMQEDLLEVLGIERKHGCELLSRMGKDFPNDQELHKRFNAWMMKAEQTCMHVMRQHQASGGHLPMGPFGDNPEMNKLQGKAKEQLEAMTPERREELLGKMAKKVEVWMNLPQEGKTSYMQKLSEEDRLQFIMTQILLVSKMQEQWKAQQEKMHQHSHEHAHQHAAASSGGEPSGLSLEEQQKLDAEVEAEVEAELAKESASATERKDGYVAPPTQQMMM